ncbi:hypothetical protein GRJ2_000324400 [Grus japonensis]|uniref:Uncharacterized protein n=1 Tax=Grus japonensis TaxID=30415 RepID=A0ABC9VZT1_GRUJA
MQAQQSFVSYKMEKRNNTMKYELSKWGFAGDTILLRFSAVSRSFFLTKGRRPETQGVTCPPKGRPTCFGHRSVDFVTEACGNALLQKVYQKDISTEKGTNYLEAGSDFPESLWEAGNFENLFPYESFGNEPQMMEVEGQHPI